MTDGQNEFLRSQGEPDYGEPPRKKFPGSSRSWQAVFWDWLVAIVFLTVLALVSGAFGMGWLVRGWRGE